MQRLCNTCAYCATAATIIMVFDTVQHCQTPDKLCLLHQVADRLEQAVESALRNGYRTGDLMSPGMKQVKCSEMGEILAEAVRSSTPVHA